MVSKRQRDPLCSRHCRADLRRPGAARLRQRVPRHPGARAENRHAIAHGRTHPGALGAQCRGDSLCGACAKVSASSVHRLPQGRASPGSICCIENQTLSSSGSITALDVGHCRQLLTHGLHGTVQHRSHAVHRLAGATNARLPVDLPPPRLHPAPSVNSEASETLLDAVAVLQAAALGPPGGTSTSTAPGASAAASGPPGTSRTATAPGL